MDQGFTFAYDAGDIHYGTNCVADLDDVLEGLGATRGLVVCGQTVGATADVVGPVTDGLGDRLAGVFDETSADKRLATAVEGARRMAESDADAVVALGSGSSMDVAKAVVAIAAADDPAAAIDRFVETRMVPVPDGALPTFVSIPTTLAGADLSTMGGIRHETDDGVLRGGIADFRLMPDALCYDPDLFRETPHGVLCSSAMNGFDKGLEALYSRNSTPITDGTAMRGLRLLGRGLPRLGAGDRDDETMHDTVVGTVLVQYGISRRPGMLSVIHSFGHALSGPYPVQQGTGHALVAPHALRLVFDQVDGRRALLAEALTGEVPDDAGAQADAVVDAVAAVRDGLGLPDQLRAVGGPARDDFPSVAQDTLDDAMMQYRPPGFDPSREDLERVLDAAW